LVLLVRAPVRRVFGSTTAYAAWVVVPVAMVAVMLPAATGSLEGALPAWTAVPRDAARELVATSGAGANVTGWAVMAWLVGVLVMASWLSLQQRAFVRGLGSLRDRGDGVLLADASAGLPAVIGVFRQRMVLPRDFERRYDARQQVLLLAHERIHVARGDVAINAAVAAIRCLSWFNPLLHYAATAFRLDQEMACDERVVERFPSLRRAYGEAMLQAQLARQPSPVGCHWGFQHPLKERIDMLRKSKPTTFRRLAGSGLVLCLSMTCGLAAWAGQPGGEGMTGPTGEELSRPRYPASALEQGLTGRVVLIVDIDPQGRATNVEVETSEPAG